MMTPCIISAQSYQRGINLVEVMVSLVILSMGLLGLVTLQGLGTQYSNKSYFRTQAIVQAYDIIDRMRANLSAASTGDYTHDPMPEDYSTDCGRDGCSTRDLAHYDLVNWNTHNARLLPDGAGLITRQGDVFTVKINWREVSNTSSAGEVKTLNVSAQL